jgi:hypothetical protein
LIFAWIFSFINGRKEQVDCPHNLLPRFTLNNTNAIAYVDNTIFGFFVKKNPGFLLIHCFVDIYGHIRADNGTLGTTGAIRIVSQNGKTNPPEISLIG